MKGVVAKDGPFPMLADMVRPTRRRGKRKAQKPVSAARKAAWKAQGRYMAAVSQASRAKVKAIRGKSGLNAGIKAAKRMANVLRYLNLREEERRWPGEKA